MQHNNAPYREKISKIIQIANNHMALNKLQIETAEQLLKNTLNKKKEELADKNFKTDVQKYIPDIQNLNKLASNLRKMAETLKKKVEKNQKLEVDLDNYKSYFSDMPKCLQEAGQIDKNDIKRIIDAKGYYNSSYNGVNLGSYEPDLEKETKEIETFILNLKLGTALMSDLQLLIDKIAKIK